MENEPSKVRVLEQLEKIVLSEEFATSPRKRKFLRYIVEKTLDGKASSIKGYAIGVDVFDRGDSFDPQLDTIVRVQARNLRKALKLFYLTEGRSDKVRVDIPKGRYVPRFSLTLINDLVSDLEHGLEGDVHVEACSSPAPFIDSKNLLIVVVLLIALLAILMLVTMFNLNKTN